ncbi:MAG TPA: hypothetical protein PLX18_12700 [Anaerohalosphaeraceae bacterium]|nr:hypothetical protein [Anaerohalosphaeraceae bacterium]HOT74012.1 hypothetical protein [Anaerohalosphaeraceae bacterium]HQG07019.1 hypothetical protein [Anaerohalosphaeraceae bacterium]HQI08704.1 hypothetical protein [Anaerohalosphaeraceae bacterium]HQJ68971.1 hypothetical protein [Anaerohalosphaeraceae bacterium]
MSEGRFESQWAHTSSIMALIANVNRDPKKGRVFTPDDFNPYARKKTDRVIEISKSNIGLMRRAFTGKD